MSRYEAREKSSFRKANFSCSVPILQPRQPLSMVC